MNASTMAEGPRFLPQRSSPCLYKLSARRPWLRTLAVNTGHYLVGLRVDNERSAETLEDLLSGIRVPDLDGVAPPNFSVEMPPETDARIRRLHLIYRDHAVVARRTDREDILLDLIELLQEPQRWLETRELAVHASAVRVNDGVALMPWEWHEVLLRHQRLLAQEGCELLVPHTHILEQRGVLTSRAVTTGRAVRSALRLPVLLWAVAVSGTPPVQRLRPAAGVHLAARGLANIEALGGLEALDRLARIAHTDLPFFGVASPSPSVLRSAMLLASKAAARAGTGQRAPHMPTAAEISPECLCHAESANSSVELSTNT